MHFLFSLDVESQENLLLIQAVSSDVTAVLFMLNHEYILRFEWNAGMKFQLISLWAKGKDGSSAYEDDVAV